MQNYVIIMLNSIIVADKINLIIDKFENQGVLLMKKYIYIFLALMFFLISGSCIPTDKYVKSLIVISGPYPDKFTSWGIMLKLNKSDLPGKDCLAQWNVSNGTLYYFDKDDGPVLIESKYNDLPYTLTADFSGGSIVWQPDNDLPETAEILIEVKVFSNPADALSDTEAIPSLKSSLTLLKNNLMYSVKRTDGE